jgi:phenylacetate-CoA ligase
MVVPFETTTPPFWIWNQAFKQLYLSSYHISESNALSYISAIQNHDIQYLLGYPSSLCALAENAINLQVELPSMKLVVSNAEPLFDFQRSIISKAFGCSVVNTYGMSELVCGASECGNGSMHLWPEAGVIEIMADDKDEVVSSKLPGRIIATGLLNFDMPLIRYETGDRGSLKSEICICGRQLPLINEIEGRIDDMVITPDGRKIGRLDPIFKADIPIREAQIIQEKLDTLRVKYVPARDYRHDDLLRKRLNEYLGEMKISLEQVESIPKGPNGKFKTIISLINE